MRSHSASVRQGRESAAVSGVGKSQLPLTLPPSRVTAPVPLTSIHPIPAPSNHPPSLPPPFFTIRPPPHRLPWPMHTLPSLWSMPVGHDFASCAAYIWCPHWRRHGLTCSLWATRRKQRWILAKNAEGGGKDGGGGICGEGGGREGAGLRCHCNSGDGGLMSSCLDGDGRRWPTTKWVGRVAAASGGCPPPRTSRLGGPHRLRDAARPGATAGASACHHAATCVSMP